MVLLCYEVDPADATDCHRSWFAGWMHDRHGLVVPEVNGEPSITFTGPGVGPGVVRVVAYVAEIQLVNGDLAITYAAPSPSGQYTDVSGTVPNTGSTVATYGVELRAVNTGETETGYAFDVQPGQTATWTASFRGGAHVQWVRTTSF